MIISSSLRPSTSDRSGPSDFPQWLRSNVVSHASTSSCSNSAEESEKGSKEKDCIFCMIIRRESPAYKGLEIWRKSSIAEC
ncbi:hypothetical protein MRB53_009451 [Persea americana]|uniref:Uncharacterized protein n=1 Tax=Persea americana TaxID=3435 RepID=A0ACC2LP19_PERAE|nr:hypothetical protein MRB53_009451 [Persea americana]